MLGQRASTRRARRPPAQYGTTVTGLPTATGLADSYGVVVHPTYAAYQPTAGIITTLADLGVKHIRTNHLYSSTVAAFIADLYAATGIKTNVTMGKPSLCTPEQSVTFAAALPSAAVASVEGLNEWNLVGGSTWSADVGDYQRRIVAAIAASGPQWLKDLPVLAPAPGARMMTGWPADQDSKCTLGNYHNYPGGSPASLRLDSMVSQEHTRSGTKAIVVTETGWHDATSSTGTHVPTPQWVIDAQEVRPLTDGPLASATGPRRVYRYELVKQGTDLTDQEQRFGIVNPDGSKTAGYTAMKRLLALCVDTAGPTESITVPAVGYAVNGAGTDLRWVRVVRSDGHHLIVMWRDVEIWDKTNKVALNPTDDQVTVVFDRSVDVTVRALQAGTATTTTGATALPLTITAVENYVLDVTPAAGSSPGYGGGAYGTTPYGG